LHKLTNFVANFEWSRGPRFYLLGWKDPPEGGESNRFGGCAGYRLHKLRTRFLIIRF